MMSASETWMAIAAGPSASTAGVATPIAFGIGASVATLIGGVLGIKLAHRIMLVLGLTAGVVLGVALFDLVPEALSLGLPASSTLAWLGLGLGGYMLFERLLGGMGSAKVLRAHLGPATLTIHSFLDGMGIGLAYQVSATVGLLVALAVLTHDVADGVNIVSLCLAAERDGAARRWLVVNGLAPLAGVLTGLVVRVPASFLSPLLAIFAGIFLYIGACELLPRSHALDPRLRTTLASLCGMALMFAVTTVAR